MNGFQDVNAPRRSGRVECRLVIGWTGIKHHLASVYNIRGCTGGGVVCARRSARSSAAVASASCSPIPNVRSISREALSSGKDSSPRSTGWTLSNHDDPSSSIYRPTSKCHERSAATWHISARDKNNEESLSCFNAHRPRSLVGFELQH